MAALKPIWRKPWSRSLSPGLRCALHHHAQVLQQINGGRADGTLERRLQTYLRPAVLVLDDFGLKPIQSPAPSDLYDVIDGRYEKGSIVLTSNRALAEWPDIFLDPLLASAGLDRLGDKAEVLVITGASYRASRHA